MIASYLNKQKPDIPLRHKSYVFFEKLTGILTAAKIGFKLPIYRIIPRKNPLPLDPTKVILKYKTGSTFDKEVIKDWIDLVISPYMISQGYSKILVIIDQATCHKKLTKSYDLIERGIHVLYLPGRMTGFLQPTDVGWFATIKNALSCSIMLMGPHLKKLKKGKEEPRLKFSKILKRNWQKQTKIIRR